MISTRAVPLVLCLAAMIWTGLAEPLRAEGDGPHPFAYFEQDGYFYPCKVEGEEKGKIKVRYSAGATALVERWGLIIGNVNVGDRFEANFQGKGRYYRGRIAQRDGDEVRINYDDGDIEHTTIARLRGRFPVKTRQVGCPVMARWDPDGLWYSGVVKEVKDTECLVVFDDGTSAWRQDKHMYGYTPTWGDVVQGKFSGDGLYYNATIIGRTARKLMLRYDDGDEEWTTMDKIRADYGLVAPKTILIDSDIQ